MVAVSSGNHGAAVAHGVKTLGTRGVVFGPEDAAPTKVEAIRALGAEVRRQGADCVVSEAAARRYSERHGQRVAIVLCGANVAPETLREILRTKKCGRQRLVDRRRGSNLGRTVVSVVSVVSDIDLQINRQVLCYNKHNRLAQLRDQSLVITMTL